MRACVIGGGAWGSAFAIHLGRIGLPTRLWIREPEVLEIARRTRENPAFLPGCEFPAAVSFHDDPAAALDGAEAVFVAVPSPYCRKIFGRLAGSLAPGQAVVSLTKGIERSTLKRMTELMAECFPPGPRPLAVLSGPSFSREVAEGHPTALVLASSEADWARRWQRLLSGPSLRLYTSRDVIGVELAGAVKNVIAIAAGISDGLGFGHNARASLLTRGLAEIARLGQRLGARPRTFSGLAGMGDLVLTCTGHLSRNRRVGLELGAGRRLRDIIADMRAVAEGLTTTVSAFYLARREGIEMPITEQVQAVLYRGKDPRRALADLMARGLKDE